MFVLTIIVRTFLFPPWAGVARSAHFVCRLQHILVSIMDGLVCRIRYADDVLRVKQRFPVLQDVLFRQRVDVVYRNTRPAHLSTVCHNVCDGLVFAPEVMASVSHDYPVPELLPLL